jgi:hypothetical protein
LLIINECLKVKACVRTLVLIPTGILDLIDLLYKAHDGFFSVSDK